MSLSNNKGDNKVDLLLINLLKNLHYRVRGRTHTRQDGFAISIIVSAIIIGFASFLFLEKSNFLVFLFHIIALIKKIITCYINNIALKEEYNVTDPYVTFFNKNTGKEERIRRKSSYSIQLWILIPSIIITVMCGVFAAIFAHFEANSSFFITMFYIVIGLSIIIDFMMDLLDSFVMLYRASASYGDY